MEIVPATMMSNINNVLLEETGFTIFYIFFICPSDAKKMK